MNEGVYKQAAGGHIVTPTAVDADGDTRIVDGGLVPLGYRLDPDHCRRSAGT